MLAYIAFIAVVFVIMHFIKKDKFNIADVILIVILICFSGLRYNVGEDFKMYEQMYFKAMTMSHTILRTGKGYYLLQIIFFKLFPNTFVPLSFLISLITNLLVYIFCKKNSSNPKISIFVYICLGFYTTSFNIFRQCLSMALILYSYNFLKDKKYVRYVILGICAILLHDMSIYAIIIILICEKVWRKNINPVFLISCGIIGAIFYNVLYNLLVSRIGSLSIYMNTDEYMAGLGTYMQLIIYLMFFMIINLNRKKLVSQNSENLIYINLFSISYIIMFLGINNILFVRASYYLSVFIILLLPELYKLFDIENKKKLEVLLYIGFIIYFLFYINSFGGVIPYHSIIGEMLIN